MFNLLLVDDDLDILELMSVALQRPGVRVLAARTQETAEMLIEQWRPSAALLDVHLTQTCRHEGLQLLARVRQANADAKVIIMTGWSSPDLLAKAYRGGAVYFMRKPIVLQELEHQLHRFGMPRHYAQERQPLASCGPDRSARLTGT